MAEWLQAEVEFASFYSYRVPDLSPSFALCSPVPSPAAIRLAVVDATIRHTGDVNEGHAVFELMKRARLELQPPSRVAVMKFFIKRLKPEKPTKGKRASVIESTGIREYCLPWGPMVFWIESDQPERIAQSLQWLRRLGTTDSLASCTVGAGTPNFASCIRPANGLTLQTTNFAQRPVFTLHELKPETQFNQVNPFADERPGKPFEKRLYVLPLVREKVGENWVIYHHEPFAA